MLFGELVTRLTDDAVAEETILSISSLPTLASLRDQAAAEGETLGEYAASAVRRYLSVASDEEWITLMGVMERAPDPGAACLRRAFAHATGGG
jgi:hypothetical protein